MADTTKDFHSYGICFFMLPLTIPLLFILSG